MSKFEKTVFKILSGTSDNNLLFKELVNVLKHFNFSERIKGSHPIFYKNNIEEILNIQKNKDGNSKAYQVKQVRELMLKYKLTNMKKDERL